MSVEKAQGGAFGGVDELYREVILDHFKSPRNKGPLAKANGKADGMNPLCGDQITVHVLIENGGVKDIKFEGHGCAISQSAASMMTMQIKGKSLQHATALADFIKHRFGVTTESSIDQTAIKPGDIGDLEALDGVKKYPVRIKCALLSWNTFLDAIKVLPS